MRFFLFSLLWMAFFAQFLMSPISSFLSQRAEAASPTKFGKHTASVPKKKSSSGSGHKAAPTGASPFVIRETYRQASTGKSEKGIVGVDLLIEPRHYPVIQRVFSGTPAQRSGIRPGDVILAINGSRVFDKTLWEVDAIISDRPGEQVDFTLLRGEKTRKISLRVESMSSLSGTQQQPFLLPWVSPE